jgi:hypothetical protein
MLDVDILKIPHHGSAYSSSEDFIKATSPDYAIISVGNNSFGHPANDFLYRLLVYDENNGTSLFDNTKTTLESGNIIVEFNENLQFSYIKNIDDYSFGNYFTYTVFVVVVITILIINPYLKIWKREIRYYLQNKKFEKVYADCSEKGNRM